MNLYLLLFDDLMKRLRWRFPVLIALTALVGISESISIVLLLPLLSLIGVAAASGQGAATKVIDRFLAFIGANSTFEILAVIIAVATIQLGLSLVLNWWSVGLARRYQAERQLEMFRAFMGAKWSFITGKKAGELTNAIITESERLGRAFTITLSLLGSAVVSVIYVAMSLLIAWQATLSLISFAFAAALTMMHLYKKSYSAGQSLAPLSAELQTMLDEQFGGAKFIKASAGADRAAARIEPLVHKLEKANAFGGAMPGMVRGLLEYMAFIGLAIILVLASKGMGVAPGNVVIVLALFGRLFPRLTNVQAQLHYLNGNLPALKAIDQLQTAADAEAERRDSASAPLKIDLPAALTIRNLEVKFDERTVLHQINLTLPIPGMVAVVGRSGAGKSTLVHTVLGLVEPIAGSIRLGNHELASAPLSAWRQTIGYVPQETVLFHASIRDNIAFVNPAASDAEVQLAARRAHAYDFIEAWPDRFDTVIGDQGVKLSGGQRQRLGIARALLAKPILLLMDEAMSALDGQSETELLCTIEELRREMGIMLVAHRLASVQAADSIYVFEDGRVVETGTWNELMGRRARLHALAEAQSFTGDRPLVTS
jgi:ATP-binding cassette subfamily C protein